MELETDRLILRSIKATDLEDIHEYSKNPNVGPNAGWKPHSSIEETSQIINELFIGQQAIWGIVLKDTDKLIGSIGLLEDPKRKYDRCGMIGYAIGEPYWGKGYMSEAANKVVEYSFKYMEVDILSAYCYPFNTRSKNVITKLGFNYEGTLKMAEINYEGNVYDNECYSLTKEEYYTKLNNI